MDKDAFLSSCNAFSKDVDLFKVPTETQYWYVHQMLSDKFNYTFSNFVQGISKGSTANLPINKNNFRINVVNRRFEWIPYGTNFKPFKFISFKSSEPATLNVLLAPFQIDSWTAFVISVVITILGSIFMMEISPGDTLLDILFAPVAITLKQSQPDRIKKFQVRKSMRACETLTSTGNWFEWIISLLVLQNDYTGKLVSNLAKGVKPGWSGTLHDAAQQGYVLLTTDFLQDIHAGYKSCLLRESYLNGLSIGAAKTKLLLIIEK